MTRTERVLFWIAIVNFGLFVGIAITLGGDAVNGKQEGGRFYLGSHGKYTEVSKGVFVLGAIHAVSMIATNLIGIIVSYFAWARLR